MTFKEFYYYSLHIEEREEREWTRQASMMSLHANMGGGKKRYTPDEFNPFTARKKKGDQVQSNEDVEALKQRLFARRRARTTE